jgi:hypothetical protein
MKNQSQTERRSVSACFSTALAVGLMSLVFSLATPAEAQSRPPAKSGATGGANPGSTSGKSGDPNQSGGSGYNPGSSGGSGYNPGNSGGSGYNPGSSGGSGYNPGSSGGSGYNPGNSGGGYNPGYNNQSFVTVFRDARFRGGSVQFDSAIDNLKNSGMNDEISSMRVSGTWLVCTDPDFRGQCQTVEGNISKLSVFGMNDNISSLRPTR